MFVYIVRLEIDGETKTIRFTHHGRTSFRNKVKTLNFIDEHYKNYKSFEVIEVISKSSLIEE